MDEDVSYFKYAQTGLELAAAVGLGFWAGYKFDMRFGTAPWVMLAGAGAGLAAGFYLVLRSLPGEKEYKSGKKEPKA
jgi:F0F1-type ATP synthase assembly protein I